MPIVIREESSADEVAIGEVTRRAFERHPYSSHTEQFIIGALRKAKALSVSLVAEKEGRVVGHLAMSPVGITDGTTGWHGLGPVCVLPEEQRQGIGSALVEEGLRRLRESGAAGCVLLGEPGFYGRFGFARRPGLILPDAPAEFFLALPFGASTPRGVVAYHEAFFAQS